MSRRGKIKRNIASPDPIYGNLLVAKLINRSMRDGKKNVAEKQVYGALEKIEKATGEAAMVAFTKAIENIKPTMEVRPRRIGGAAYQVPMPVRGKRQDSLAIRWLVAAARAKSNSEFHTFADKLFSELLDASKGEGGAVKKRLEVERIAEANRAFAHFKW